MKDDFQRLEDDMTKLRSRMIEIRSSSDLINDSLSERKQQIMKLSSVHHLLKKVCLLNSPKENYLPFTAAIFI